MASITNNLYPPTIDSYQATFLRVASSTRIEFTLSRYNSASQIKYVQVYISRQNQSYSAFDRTLYPGGVKVCELLSTGRQTDNGDQIYYVDIDRADITNRLTETEIRELATHYYTSKESATPEQEDAYNQELERRKHGFLIGEYYKIQVRLELLTCPSYGESKDGKIAQPTTSQIVNCQDFYSEWSTVSLIKAIDTPIITLKNLTESGNNINLVVSNSLDVVGTMTFADPNENEGLSMYDIRLTSRESIVDEETECFISPIVYVTQDTTNNEFNYTSAFDLEEDKFYTLYLHYVTSSGYEDTVAYQIRLFLNEIPVLRVDVKVTQDTENGSAVIALQAKGNTPKFRYTGPYTIRRTSSLSNYTEWEDIYTDSVYQKLFSFEEDVFRDYYIEAGVFYRYCVQERNSDGGRGKSIIGEFYELEDFYSVMRTNNLIYHTNEEYLEDVQNDDSYLNTGKFSFLADFEDIFLSNYDRQLRVRFDATVDSYKHNIVQNQFETLGSKYPFIVRGADVDYRSFSLSGLITAFMDEDNLFTTDEEMYNGDLSAADYNDYYQRHVITNSTNFYKEKAFREQVIKFLYADEHKMFRSPAEGNIVVRLSDISLIPKTELGRMLYSFTCTATEVGEFDYAELYNLRTDKNIYSTFHTIELLGQVCVPARLYNGTAEASNILNAIKLNHLYNTVQGGKTYFNRLLRVNWIDIECNFPLTYNNDSTFAFGYYPIRVNNTLYKINHLTGTLHLDFEETDRLTFLAAAAQNSSGWDDEKDTIIVTYKATFEVVPDVSNEYEWITAHYLVGQAYQIFQTNQDKNLYQQVVTPFIESQKYSKNANRLFTSFKGFYDVKIEGNPGSYIRIDYKDTDIDVPYEIMQIPETGILHLNTLNEKHIIYNIQPPTKQDIENYKLNMSPTDEVEFNIEYICVVDTGGYKSNES